LAPWILLAAAYLIGSFPFGLYLTKWIKGIDVREAGSGNIGATNVFRVAGKPLGVAVFCLDVGKGLWPPLAANAMGLNTWWQVVAGLAAIVGHNSSPFLGFKGGKGVATSLGVLLGVAWKVGTVGFLLWSFLVVTTGIVSIGSLAAILSLVPLALLFYPGDYAILTLNAVAAAFSLYKHRGNIQRLRAGTEPSFRKKKS
jgi:acyl phosphate:glycerol-3-phosphate acyltransferase